MCESLPVSVALSEPPHSTVSDLRDVFRQPSHIVSLTLAPLPHESELEREADRRKNERQAAASPSGRTCGNYGPTPAASGLYQPPRASPLSSPQAKRRAKTLGEGRREMDRLLVQLDEVSQTLERTHSRCEDIARRCDSGSRRARSAGEEGFEEADWGSDDQRVERLLRVADNLTAQIISQQRRSPTPTLASGELVEGSVCLYCNVCLSYTISCLHPSLPRIPYLYSSTFVNNILLWVTVEISPIYLYNRNTE